MIIVQMLTQLQISKYQLIKIAEYVIYTRKGIFISTNDNIAGKGLVSFVWDKLSAIDQDARLSTADPFFRISAMYSDGSNLNSSLKVLVK